MRLSANKWLRLDGPRCEKTCLWGFANNKGTDQPAHPRSLISAFVIRLLISIISRLATSEISLFYLVSVAEETGLSLALSEPRRQVFSRRGPDLLPQFVCMNSEFSDEIVCMSYLIEDFDRYQNLMSWLQFYLCANVRQLMKVL